MLRLSRICSSEKDFKGHVDRMKEWFLARDYSENVVNKQSIKVSFFFFFFFCIPFEVKLNKYLLSFLYNDEEVQKNFWPSPMVSYKSARKNKRLNS